MYSLVPNGSIIICESIADYDENVPMPSMSEEHQAKLMEENVDKDPVMKALHKLGEAYFKYVKPLMNMNYQPDNTEDILEAIDTLNHTTSEISEKLVKRITKLAGTIMIGNAAYCHRYCGDKFYAHIADFLKNKKKIYQAGLGEYRYMTDELEMFCGDWQISRILGVVQGKPELLDMYMDPDTFSALCGADRDLGAMFGGLPDLLYVFFENPERLSRAERHREKTLYLDRLIEDLQLESEDVPLHLRDLDGPGVIRFISGVTRRTMQDLYDIQSDVIDGKVDVNLSKIMTRLINLFGIGTIYIMYLAYELRLRYNMSLALDRYTDQLLIEIDRN